MSDSAKPESVSSEIRVVKYACSDEGNEVYGLFLADEEGRHYGRRIAQINGYGSAELILEHLNVRKTMPVSSPVSLEKCVEAIRKAEPGNYTKLTKAVLDAAGVKYHED